MKLSGENNILAPRQQVWEALNDAKVLQDTIPGAQSVEKSAVDEFKAVVEVKIGPVKAKFTGKINLTDLDPPNGYKISGQGQGGAAGFAKGSAEVKLSESEKDQTKLSYNVDAQVGGKLAQVGQRLIQNAAKSLADQFFNNLEAYFNNNSDQTGLAEDEILEKIENNNTKILFFNNRRNKILFAIIVFMISFFIFYK
tara:strand:+ start:8405 stop:8995 length:591 start_codon:yes stop_codon:yes gene_type:complete